MNLVNKNEVILSTPFKIILGGFGPPNTSFSKALKFIGDQITIYRNKKLKDNARAQ